MAKPGPHIHRTKSDGHGVPYGGVCGKCAQFKTICDDCGVAYCPCCQNKESE